MQTVCLLSLKGGAGKSSVVQSLAVAACEHGQRTLIVELDPQGSLKNWSRRRDAEEPPVHQTLPQSLPEVLEDANNRNVHWVFLDTPGHDASTAAAAAALADIVLIPCKIQSTKDFDSVLASLAEAKRADTPAYVLMNQVPPNSPRLVRRRQVEIQREYNVSVLSKFLCRRVDYEYCDAQGLSAAEYNPGGAAAEEIKQLYVLLQSIFITLRLKEQAQQSLSAANADHQETAVAIPRDVALPDDEPAATEDRPADDPAEDLPRPDVARPWNWS